MIGSISNITQTLAVNSLGNLSRAASSQIPQDANHSTSSTVVSISKEAKALSEEASESKVERKREANTAISSSIKHIDTHA